MKYVISLGGSLIVPDMVDYKYLYKFVRFVKKLSKKHKIVVVCGGGSVARRYIKVLKGHAEQKSLSLVGIETTKLNARLVAGLLNYFGEIPDSLSEVVNQLRRTNLVVCGALGVQPNMTSDANAAQIAKKINAVFVNLTDVNGLYDKDPKENKNAKLVSNISYSDFNKIINKIKYHAGQHFILDQVAAMIITKNKIKTVILNGKKFKNLNNFFKGKDFIGTMIN